MSKWGQDPARSAAYNHRAVVTNNLLLVCISLCIFLASLFYYQGAKNHFYGQCLAVGIYAASLLLSALKKVEWAKIVALTLSNLGMFTFMTALGEHRGITLIIITLVSVPFVVFEFRQWYKIAVFVLAPLVLYYLLNITDYKFIPFEPVAYNLKEIIYLILFVSSTLSIALCIVFLIKERLDDQKKLSERQSLISKIAEISPNIIYIFDLTSDKPIYANNNLHNIMGYEKEELSWSTLKNLLHPQDLAIVEENTRILFSRKDNQPVITTYRMQTKNGGYVWLRNRSQVFERDAKGRVKLVLGVSEDITEKIAEKEAYTSLDYMQKNILEASPYAIISTDAYGIITTFNTAAEKMFGYSALELVGKKTPSKMFDRREVIARAKQMSKDLGVDITPPLFVIVQRPLLGLPDFSEWTYVRKDGTRLPALITVNVLKDEKGNVTGYLGIAQDITTRKREEQALTKAKNAAEDANKAKSQFLANMSHEIRTPLNGILGFAELLKTPDLPKTETNKYVEMITKGGDRLLGVINDILDVSKIEAGLMELDLSNTDIHLHTQYVFSFFSSEAEKKGIKFDYKNGSTSERLYFQTDREKLYAILINLLKNAIKFTDKGSIEFGYRVNSNVLISGSKVNPLVLEFYVKDTGIGIPENRQEAIFDRFTQSITDDTRAIQGNGLGLSIAKSYVEMLGGELWVESKEGEGSTFYFTISDHPMEKVKS